MSSFVKAVWSLVAVIVAAAGLAVAGCRERQPTREAVTVTSGGDLRDACAGDSLRPATAAPAEGLWVGALPGSRVRVAARIGPPRPEDGSLVVTRPVETLEVTVEGDTIRERVDAARVSLELLPAPRNVAVSGDGMADSAGSSQPAAGYAASSRIRLAAYEPCLTSTGEPHTRYLRRDEAGRVVTDVMLRRVSDR